MAQNTFTLRPGFEDTHRDQVCQLFWQAFENKLRIPMGPEPKALAFLRRVADPSHAISAVSPDGQLLGVAGFKTPDGALIGGEWSDLVAVYGTFGSLWRALLLSLLERGLQKDTLTMDGIFVTEAARGHGIGTALLHAIKKEAATRALANVRLDVIDTNPRARALYEREGFIAGDVQSLGPLSYVFGFESATTMIYTDSV